MSKSTKLKPLKIEITIPAKAVPLFKALCMSHPTLESQNEIASKAVLFWMLSDDGQNILTDLTNNVLRGGK